MAPHAQDSIAKVLGANRYGPGGFSWLEAAEKHAGIGYEHRLGIK